CLQVYVYPLHPVCIRHVRLGRGDGPLFYQPDRSRVCGEVPVRWLGADGDRRSHNRLLADVVCGKDPSPWRSAIRPTGGDPRLARFAVTMSWFEETKWRSVPSTSHNAKLPKSPASFTW